MELGDFAWREVLSGRPDYNIVHVLSLGICMLSDAWEIWYEQRTALAAHLRVGSDLQYH